MAGTLLEILSKGIRDLTNNFWKSSFGLNSGNLSLTTAGSTVTGVTYEGGIQIINDAVFTSLKMTGEDTTNLVGPTLPAGLFIGGTVTQMTVASGLVRIYK